MKGPRTILWFQPLHPLSTNKLAGEEAYYRWQFHGVWVGTVVYQL